MPIYRQQPFFKLVIPLIAGILIQSRYDISVLYCLGFLAAFASLCFIIALAKNEMLIKLLAGSVLMLSFFVLGMVSVSLNKRSVIDESANKGMYVASFTNVPNKKNDSYRANLKIIAKLEKSIWYESEMKLQAYFENDEKLKAIKAGDKIIFSGELKPIEEPKNPFDFNFQRYLNLKNIELSCYIKTDDWLKVLEEERGIKQKALNLRQQLISVYENAGLKDDQLAVFAALTLGYKNKLDGKVKKAYSGAGAMHVLAVSGMHVGIIYLVLDWFFKLITFFKRKSKYKYVAIIALLWVYALITGLSTSVLRATIMFSFVLLGYLFSRRSNVYNSLGASALLLLLFNPNILYEVGFQLSYAAVIGIVYFYPKINKWINLPYKPLRYVWSLTAVSISAQIATFPIAVYYFNQFSTYFWLSNIVVSLAAVILLFSAIILVVVSPFDTISQLLGSVVNNITEWVNAFVFGVNKLPFAVINNIGFDKIQAVLLYVVIILVSTWFVMRKRRFLISALAVVLLLLTLSNAQLIRQSKSNSLFIYHLRNESAIQIVTGVTSNWYLNSETLYDSTFITRANRYWNVSDYDESVNLHLMDKNLISMYGFNGLIVDDDLRPFTIDSNKGMLLDFILVRGNPTFKYSDLPKDVQCEHVVIDGSVPPWVLNEWLNLENVCVHYTKRDGMFLLTSNQ